jgi:Fe-S cluster assembly scaffold protein SufB
MKHIKLYEDFVTESKDMKRWGNELWNRADEFKRKKLIQSRLGVEQPTEDLVKLPWSELPQEIRKEVIEIKEMASTDVHYKNIMAHYDQATATGKHQIEIVVTGKKSNRAKVEEELLDTTYEDILQFEEELGIIDKY